MTMDVPKRIAALPRDGVGRPVPWFVATVNGKPDFRVMDPDKFQRAIIEGRCWVCGQKFTGRTRAFVIGPMCAVNRVSAEPPSHRECGEFSARACPFLNNPHKQRREANMPEAGHSAGVMIARNPGVTLVWITTSYKVESDGAGGTLFRIGPASRCDWFAEGRDATRAEVMASIDSGLPILQQMADEEGDGAPEALARLHSAALELVPA